MTSNMLPPSGTGNARVTADQLQKDSDDIDLALSQFMKERNAALYNQVQAKCQYDNEMKNLEEANNIIDYQKAMKSTVDHNLLRHLRADYDGDGDDFEDNDEMNLNEETLELLKQANSQSNKQFAGAFPEAKKPMPSFERKGQIRESMFQFLDEAHEKELELVRAN